MSPTTTLSGYADFNATTGKGKIQLSTSGSATLRVSPIQDSRYEGDETVTATLIVPEPEGHTIGPQNTASGTIVDDDPVPVTVSVSAVEGEAKEAGPVRGRLKFTRSGGNLSASVSANYRVRDPNPPQAGVANDNGYSLTLDAGGAVVSGAAGGGADAGYTLRTVAFGANVTDVFVNLNPAADVSPEGDETAAFEVLPRDGGTYPYSPPAIAVGGGPATITIKDKPIVSMGVTEPEARELGEVPGGFRVSLARPHFESLTVRFRLPGGGAPLAPADLSTPALALDDATGDFVGSVTIPAGATSADVSVKPVRDLLKEGDETAAFSLKADPAYAIGTTGVTSASVRVTDLAVVSIAATDTATESAASGAGFTVSRTHDGNRGSLAVGLELGAGTATAGQDFAALPTTVTIADGSPSVFVPLTPVNDTTPEWTESVVLDGKLDNTKYLRADVFSADAEIVDDDPVSLSLADVVTVNNDDDNDNQIPDKDETGSVAGENDLLPLTLTLPEDVKQGARVSLSASTSRVSVWKDQSRSEAVLRGSTSSKTWVVGADAVPPQLWVEGLVGSAAVGDISFTFSASDSSASPPPRRATTSSANDTATGMGIRIVDGGQEVTSRIKDILIGQMVHAVAVIDAPPEWRQEPTYEWTVEGDVLKDYHIAADDNWARKFPLDDGHPGDEFVMPSNGLKQGAIDLFWASTPTSPKFHKLRLTVGNVNGQSHTALATYDVYKPTSTAEARQGVARRSLDGAHIGLFANAGVLSGMEFLGSVQVPAPFTDGEWHFVQRIRPGRGFVQGDGTYHKKNNGLWGLDGSSPYPAPPTDQYTTPGLGWATGLSTHQTNDSPSMPLRGEWDKVMLEAEAFRMYQMFRPPGSDSRWIPLKTVDWSYSITAVK